MRHYDHLLDKFPVSNETRELASDLLRQAKSRTAQGSGRELGEFSTGLPAVCTLLASERLNTNEMSQQSAQVASCLKRKDFQKVYGTVRSVIEEFEKEEGAKSTYAKLHERYNTGGMVEEKLRPYFTEIENELTTLATGYDHTSAMFRCLVYFWVCGSAKLKSIPPTDVFALDHHLHMRKFVDILNLLNIKKLDLKKEIQAMFSRSRKASPSKQSATVAPRQSPRKAAATAETVPELPSKAAAARSVTVEEPQTPRRSQRTLTLQQESLSKATPTKRTPRASTSPTKLLQPPPARIRFPNKGPIRELPSKDTPKKRTVETLQEEDGQQKRVDMSPEEPPVKRMKVTVEESPSKRMTRSASASAAASPKAKAETAAIEAIEAVEAAILNSPRKRKGGQAASVFPEWSKGAAMTRNEEGAEEIAEPADSASSDEESEPEVPVTRRRFRPVYSELRQWNTRDHRLSKIWRRAEKRLNVVMQAV